MVLIDGEPACNEYPSWNSEHVRQKLVITPGNTRLWVPICENPDMKPFVNQQFKSLDEAEKFYRTYAGVVGFDVRRSTKITSPDGTVVRKYLLCSRQGFKNDGKRKPLKSVSPVPQTPVTTFASSVKRKIRRRVTNRVGCKARFVLRLNGCEGYIVQLFEENHNHPLASKECLPFLKENREINSGHENFILNCIRANIGPVKSFKLYKEMVRGYENIGATSVDFKNYKRDLLAYISGADAQLLIDKFYKKQEISSAFYFDYELDESDRLKRIFWADPISRKNFAAFGDVVSFDATYRTNRYKMVFAPFTGVDNHKKCVTFAAALIATEDVESYVWVLEQFKKAMVHEPQYIITDQDPSILIAFSKVFETAIHRYCMWHIMMKVSTKVGPVLSSDEVFNQMLKDIVWNVNIEPGEFEEKWMGVMKDFNLVDHKWFLELFDIRQHWIPAFFRDVSMSGLLRTTSRSESENSWFGNFTNQQASLIEFSTQFDSAMDSQRNISSKLKSVSESCFGDLITSLDMEVDARSLYTDIIYIEVQNEMWKSIYGCRIFCSSKDEMNGKIEFDIQENSKLFKVVHKYDGSCSTCSCKKFERFGWLCRHIFLVLKDLEVKVIPRKYVISRWTKNAFMNPIFRIDDAILEQCAKIDERKLLLNRLWSDIYLCVALAEVSTERLLNFSELIKEQKEILSVEQQGSSTKKQRIESFCGTAPDEIAIHPPVQSKNKGGGKRKKSGQEKSIEEQQRKEKQRVCKTCGEREGHNSRTCPKKKEQEKKN